MTDESHIPDEILNDKNKHTVRCDFCYSLILKEQLGEYVENEFELPLMQQKHRGNNEKGEITTELLRDFWLVGDIYTFENIGFSNTVDNRKFLICADCEMGPVGYHDIDNKKCYIALKRVRHGDEPEAVMEPEAVSEEDQ